MSSCASLTYLLFFFIFICFKASIQDPIYVYNTCSPRERSLSDLNFTVYKNIDAVLTSLSSVNASYSTGFQTATAGQSPNTVTGLFLCRGDVLPEVCRNCVTFSVDDTLYRCPNSAETTLYYDMCMLRYSDKNIISSLDAASPYPYFNLQNVTTDPKGFRSLVLSTMNLAIPAAASSPRRFDVRKANWTASQTLYCLVQCTPDLTTEDCLSCLQININNLPDYAIGGRILGPSCNSRFELYPFYNESAIPTPPPPPGPPPLAVYNPPQSEKGGKVNVLVVAIVVALIAALLLFIAGYCFFAKRKKKTHATASAFAGDDLLTADTLQLDYGTVQTATNNFAESNKIGEGGFGEVYKGMLVDGTEVAVKKLSRSLGQGDTEFKNEVVLVAKLQHKNLVKLLGFCIEGEERVLVYEYVLNKSLDYILFDPAKQSNLDWTHRYNIIRGIARGIQYLHEDSRPTIIHRDLKASNILLDADMNAKIADFGIARIFGMNQTEKSTHRIVGTYGYMSPEYAMHGQYSVKSDVYSFGVLVLEIISGKQISPTSGLVSHAWMLWSEGTPLHLLDPAIGDKFQSDEVIKCVHIGLSCVQEDPVMRPTLETIIPMLTRNIGTLPLPKKPGLFNQTRPNIDLLDSDQFTTTKSVVDFQDTNLTPR